MRPRQGAEFFERRMSLLKQIEVAEKTVRFADRAFKRAPNEKSARHAAFRRGVLAKLRKDLRQLMDGWA